MITDEPDKNKVQVQQQMKEFQSNEAIVDDDKDPSTILLYDICYTLNILPSSSKNYNLRNEGKRVERLRDYIYIYSEPILSHICILFIIIETGRYWKRFLRRQILLKAYYSWTKNSS